MWHKAFGSILLSLCAASASAVHSQAIPKKQEAPPETYDFNRWADSKMQLDFLNTIFGTHEKFIGSRQWKDPDVRPTLFRFFSRDEYALLEGNEILGYYSTAGFLWEKGAKEVYFAPLSYGVMISRSVSPESWKIACQLVCRLCGFKYGGENAPIKVETCLVWVGTKPPGVLYEMRIRGTKGTMLARISQGKPSIGEALASTLQFVLLYAQKQDGHVATEEERQAEIKKVAEEYRRKKGSK
jgi:hypothetical protein